MEPLRPPTAPGTLAVVRVERKTRFFEARAKKLHHILKSSMADSALAEFVTLDRKKHPVDEQAA